MTTHPEMSVEKTRHEGCTACFALWFNSKGDNLFVEKQIDKALSGYYFYPEPEWKKYGIAPPEKFPLVGSWRNLQGTVFAFLLEGETKKHQGYSRHVMLYVVGNSDEIQIIENKITELKTDIAHIEKKESRSNIADQKIQKEHKSKSITRLTSLIGVFTVIVNAFSLYLRKLPTPEGMAPMVVGLYNGLIMTVHFLALTLLIIMIVICILYILKYGFLLLKRF